MRSTAAWVRMGAMAVAAGLVVLACTDTTGVDTQITIAVSPATSTLVSLGERLQLAARVEVTQGPVPSPVWTTRDVDVAGVGDDGRVVAVGNGETWIVAMVEAGGVKAADSARIVVAQVPADLRVQSTLDTLTWLGATARLSAAAVDALGNEIADARFVWASLNEAAARVDSSGTVTALANGDATIAVTLGGLTAQVTLAVAQEVTTVEVSPAAVSITVGATQQFTATAKDVGGSTVSGVKFLWVSANANVATVDTTGKATGKGAGVVTITAAGRGEPGNAVLTVGTTPATATKLVFTAQPSTSVAGQALSPAVEVELRDDNDNLITSARNSVTLAIAANPGSGTLSGTKTVAAVNGVASFSGLSVNKTGAGYTLSAAATSLAGATSSTFAITPAAPVKLAFNSQPGDTEGNVVLNPAVTVTILDQFDNVVTNATNAITVALGANPWASIFSTGGTLSGTKTVSAASGVATFSNLKVDKPGPGYTLTAGATGLTGATSNPFGIKLTVQVGAAAEDGIHTCAITTGGTYCWGYNGYGELGDGTFEQDSVARLVGGGLTFTKIAAGAYHTCALTGAGAAYCWGNGYDGQLGNNASNYSQTPVAVSGGLTFSQLSAGRYHTCGLSGTSIYCWGYDGNGQLGDDVNYVSKLVPTKVAGSTQWAAVTAGRYHTCGRTTGGDAYCWGYDGYGGLGDNNTFAQQPTPVAVRDSTGAAKTWKAIEAGMYHTCGIDANDAAFCWGRNTYGQLGVDTTKIAVGTSKGTPVTVFGALTFASINAAQEHTCGITVSGATYCWGYDYDGRLGSGSTSNDRLPLRTLVAGNHTFTGLTSGGGYMCAKEGTAQVWCWGNNNYGNLGDGSRETKNAPVQIVQ